MAISLRNPETQAKASGWLVAASLLVLVAALAVAMSRGGFSWEDRVFVYQSTGKRLPIVFGMTGLGLMLACAAFWLAYSSASERRNPRSNLSWICFFVSAFTVAFGFVFLYAYKAMALVVRSSAA